VFKVKSAPQALASQFQLHCDERKANSWARTRIADGFKSRVHPNHSNGTTAPGPVTSLFRRKFAPHFSIRVQVSKSRLQDNKRSGIAVGCGASANLTHCSLGSANAVQATGVEAKGQGTRVELLSCSIQRNANCGVMAYNAASVAARGCQTVSNNVGYYVLSDAVANLSNCHSKFENSYCEQGGSVNRARDCMPP
jgi:hypothetical protein